MSLHSPSYVARFLRELTGRPEARLYARAEARRRERLQLTRLEREAIRRWQEGEGR